MKKLMFVLILIGMFVVIGKAQDLQLLKANTVASIKKDLLAPSTFKLERFNFVNKTELNWKEINLCIKNSPRIIDSIKSSKNETILKDSINKSILNQKNLLDLYNSQKENHMKNCSVTSQSWDTLVSYNNKIIICKANIEKLQTKIDSISETLDRHVYLYTAAESLKKLLSENSLSFPFYNVHIVYQCMTRGAGMRCFEEDYTLDKNYKNCVLTDDSTLLELINSIPAEFIK